MIRVVLTVLLAVALVSASMPTIETARYERAESHLVTTVDRLDRTAASLVVTDDPTGPWLPDAGRYLSVRLPTATFTTVRVDRVVIDGRDAPGAGGTVAATLSERRSMRFRVKTDIRTPDGPIALTEDRTRLWFGLQSDGSVVVRIA